MPTTRVEGRNHQIALKGQMVIAVGHGHPGGGSVGSLSVTMTSNADHPCRRPQSSNCPERANGHRSWTRSSGWRLGWVVVRDHDVECRSPVSKAAIIKLP